MRTGLDTAVKPRRTMPKNPFDAYMIVIELFRYRSSLLYIRLLRWYGECRNLASFAITPLL